MDYSLDTGAEDPVMTENNEEQSQTKSFNPNERSLDNKPNYRKTDSSKEGIRFPSKSQGVPIRKKAIIPSADSLRYPGVPVSGSSGSDLAFCVARNLHKLDIVLSRWFRFCLGLWLDWD